MWTTQDMKLGELSWPKEGNIWKTKLMILKQAVRTKIFEICIMEGICCYTLFIWSVIKRTTQIIRKYHLLAAYKLLSCIFLLRLTAGVDRIIGYYQCWFWQNHIMFIHQILEKKWEDSGTVYKLFLNFNKAYDTIRRNVWYNIFIKLSVPMSWSWKLQYV